ncbi:Uncharacterised protein [uncultured archaeon]|nr:Uncharacterised protein [uncultured archaeon]
MVSNEILIHNIGGHLELKESEIVMLFLVFGAMLAVAPIYRKKCLPKMSLIYAGFLFLIYGYVFTLLKDIFYYGLFNLLEHVSYAISGVVFAAGCLRLLQGGEDEFNSGH